MIIHGLKVYSEKKCKDRITLSEGTTATTLINGQKINSVGFISRGNWRLPSSIESKRLIDKCIFHSSYNQIFIVGIPRRIQSQLRGIGLQDCNDKSEVAQILGTENWSKTKEELVNFSKQFLKNEEEIIDTGVCYTNGNLMHTTVNTKISQYTGLHIDSWEKYDFLSERKNSRNRICFNLSSYPRYFMFLNLDLEMIYRLTNRDKGPSFYDLRGYDYSFINDFFSENLNYPIVKVKINPYEAYIAPTENIIHDGNTEGNCKLDITFTLRSKYFYRKANEPRYI